MSDEIVNQTSEEPVYRADGQRLFGMDAELERKLQAKRDPELERELGKWIEDVTHEKLEFPDDLGESLKSGIMLCKLINALKPDTIKKINTKKIALMETENIRLFLAACAEWGVSGFSPSDLQEKKGIPHVINTLQNLTRVAQTLPGYNGPKIGPKVAPKSSLKKWEVKLNEPVYITDLEKERRGSTGKIDTNSQIFQEKEKLEAELLQLKKILATKAINKWDLLVLFVAFQFIFGVILLTKESSCHSFVKISNMPLLSCAEGNFLRNLVELGFGASILGASFYLRLRFEKNTSYKKFLNSSFIGSIIAFSVQSLLFLMNTINCSISESFTNNFVCGYDAISEVSRIFSEHVLLLPSIPSYVWLPVAFSLLIAPHFGNKMKGYITDAMNYSIIIIITYVAVEAISYGHTFTGVASFYVFSAIFPLLKPHLWTVELTSLLTIPTLVFGLLLLSVKLHATGIPLAVFIAFWIIGSVSLISVESPLLLQVNLMGAYFLWKSGLSLFPWMSADFAIAVIVGVQIVNRILNI